jgi:hypothetical protein
MFRFHLSNLAFSGPRDEAEALVITSGLPSNHDPQPTSVLQTLRLAKRIELAYLNATSPIATGSNDSGRHRRKQLE